MQRIRLTYPGALHHAMNRGHGGEMIFSGSDLKKVFIDMLAEASRKLKIKVIAYCLLDNHYHLVVENSSGRLSEFFKHLNGRYGIYYRKKRGGKGYVFQSRFRSEIIQDDSYLVTVITYVLMNPVRAKIDTDFLNYPWSSAQSYYHAESALVDQEYVRGLFGTKSNFISQVQGMGDGKLPILRTDVGDVIGSEGFAKKALDRFERRNGEEGRERKRVDDRYFDPYEKIIQEFEHMKGISIDEIDVGGYTGKRLRGELLFYLKDNGGLTYGEIAEMPIFGDIQMSSLGKLYQDARRRFKQRSQEVKHRAE
jgi:REP element-mobilizing transposase RayT